MMLDVAELEELLSRPTEALIGQFGRLRGDVVILGINGKMGASLGRMAVRAVAAAGEKSRVIGVSRFSTAASRDALEKDGIETIACDLTDAASVSRLPLAENVIFMAGRKFGTQDDAEQTWAINTLTAGNVGSHYRGARIVAFSTGCVYPLVSSATAGSVETDPVGPVGEYANSCLGRERLFQFAASTLGARVLLYRLNYAVDMRYGVLHDIAMRVWQGEPVDNRVSHFNAIWQGDANVYALRCLELAASPAAILNVTGPEKAEVEAIAARFGELMDRKVSFTHPVAGDRGYLSCAQKAFDLFGLPTMPLERLIALQAEWILNEGQSLGKKTCYEVTDGSY